MGDYVRNYSFILLRNVNIYLSWKIWIGVIRKEVVWVIYVVYIFVFEILVEISIIG